MDFSDFNDGINRDGRVLTSLLANDASQVDIFVPLNSAAGEYAAIQHDVVKGRGVGTRAKGSSAGWKFIERAITDNADRITRAIEKGWADVLEAFGRGGRMRVALSNIGLVVQRGARRNAKRSPSKAQYLRTLKTIKGRRKSKFKASPGTLEKSIKYEVS